MNINAVSPECAAPGQCSDCRFEDCACECREPVDQPTELDVCHHGVGFDEECENCEEEIEAEDE